MHTACSTLFVTEFISPSSGGGRLRMMASESPAASPCSGDVSITIHGMNGVGDDSKEPLLDSAASPEEEEDTNGGSQTGGSSSSFIRTCFNGFNALSGVGILSIPYALSEGGWLSLVILFSMAIIFYYTGMLLQRCMACDPSIKTYSDIGHYAFGYKGRVLASVFLCLELYLVAVGFLILEGDNLDKLFPDKHIKVGAIDIAGKQVFVMLMTLIILPTTWFRSLRLLAYISIGGALASVTLVVCVLWAGLVDGVGFHEGGKLINLRGLPTALGLYAFSFCGHAVFPTICNSMKDKTKFPKVLILCFALCTLTNASIAILGYLMYGETVQSQISLNLPVGKLSTNIAVATTLINPITKYALTLTPVATSIEGRLLAHDKGSAPFLVRTALVLSTMVIALAVPFFGNLMSLVGSFLGVCVSLLLPCIFNLKIFKASNRSRAEVVAIVAVLGMGFLVATVGTYSSIKQIINSY